MIRYLLEWSDFVLGENIQIILPSLRVYFISINVVIMYYTIKPYMLPPTLLK